MSVSTSLPSPNPMTEVTRLLREQLAYLVALNSVFPATQTFLQSCGVTKVSELSEGQMADLKAYLHMRLGR